MMAVQAPAPSRSTCSSTLGGMPETTISRETPRSRTAIALTPVALSTSSCTFCGIFAGSACSSTTLTAAAVASRCSSHCMAEIGDRGREDQQFGDQHEADGEQQQLGRQPARQRHGAGLAARSAGCLAGFCRSCCRLCRQSFDLAAASSPKYAQEADQFPKRRLCAPCQQNRRSRRACQFRPWSDRAARKRRYRGRSCRLESASAHRLIISPALAPTIEAPRIPPFGVGHHLDVPRRLALGLGAVVLGVAASAGCASPRLCATRLRLGQPDMGELGIGEGDPRDDAAVLPRRQAEQQRADDQAGMIAGDMGESAARRRRRRRSHRRGGWLVRSLGDTVMPLPS